MKIIRFFLLLFVMNAGIAQEELERLYYPTIQLGDVPYEFAAQVHSLEDFIKRYNGINNGIGRPYDTTSQDYQKIRSNEKSWGAFRRKVITSLFERSFFEKEMEQNIDFVDYLVSSDPLALGRNRIYAEVSFTSLYDCRMIFGALVLQFQGTLLSGYEWKIIDVVFDEKLIPENIVKELVPIDDRDLFIPPNAHNNNFIFLHRLIHQKKEIAPYILSSTKGISIFNHMMRYPEFSVDFTETHFLVEVDPTHGFVLNKDYKIVARDFESNFKSR